MTKKLDLRKDLKYLYGPSAKQVELVRVPAFKFAMIDGRIEPGSSPSTSPGFQEAVGALYGLAYSLKFLSKRRDRNPIDYPVMALEGLWWVDGSTFDFDVTKEWNWTLMILQPAHVTAAMFREALQELGIKRPNPALERMRLVTFREGLCVQTMHVGPYSTEPETLARMESFASERGYRSSGKHHEIYLGDPRRAKPEKLRTILRHPVEKTAA